MSQRLVDLIRKTAQELSDPPGANPAPKSTSIAPNSFVGPLQGGAAKPAAPRGNATIKAMQQELIHLAQTITAQLNVQDLSSDDPRKQQEAAGRDSFGAFITKHYLRSSDVPGVEFDPNPQKAQMADKKPGMATRLSVVMDTMKRIGNPTAGEQFADGVWGPRTNAALHNAYAFASSMLKLSQDFNLNVRSYNNADLKNFQTCIPENEKDKDLTWKIEAAGLAIKHLQLIEKMYNEIKAGVLEKPQYRAYIEGDKPYLTYPKGGANLTPQQLANLKQTFSNGFNVPVGENQTAVIGVDDLVSLDSLKEWIVKNAPQQDPYNILTLVSNQLSQKKAG
jgi:hypothetical protein